MSKSMTAEEQIEILKSEIVSLRRLLAENQVAWKRREEFHDRKVGSLERELGEQIAYEAMNRVLDKAEGRLDGCSPIRMF